MLGVRLSRGCKLHRPILPVCRRGILSAGNAYVDIRAVHDIGAVARALQPAFHYLLDAALSCGDVFPCCSPRITRCSDALAEAAAVLSRMREIIIVCHIRRVAGRGIE